MKDDCRISFAGDLKATATAKTPIGLDWGKAQSWVHRWHDLFSVLSFKDFTILACQVQMSTIHSSNPQTKNPPELLGFSSVSTSKRIGSQFSPMLSTQSSLDPMGPLVPGRLAMHWPWPKSTNAKAIEKWKEKSHRPSKENLFLFLFLFLQCQK